MYSLPRGEGWGESKKTKGFPMFLCTKLIIKAVYKYCLIFRIGIIFTVDCRIKFGNDAFNGFRQPLSISV